MKDLRTLRREFPDGPVLSVYAAAGDEAPVTRSRGWLRLNDDLRAAQAEVPAQEAAGFALALRNLSRALLAAPSSLFLHRWSGFATRDGARVLAGLPGPITDRVVWDADPFILPLVPITELARPVVGVLVEPDRVRLFMSVAGSIRQQQDVDAADSRGVFQPPIRRIVKVLSLVPGQPLVLISGTTRLARDLHAVLRPVFGDRVARVWPMPPAVDAMTAAHLFDRASITLRAHREANAVAMLLAGDGGAGPLLGHAAAHQAAAAGTADEVMISGGFVARSPVPANTVASTVLAHGGRVRIIESAQGAELLERTANGMAVRPRHRRSVTLCDLHPVRTETLTSGSGHVRQ